MRAFVPFVLLSTALVGAACSSGAKPATPGPTPTSGRSGSPPRVPAVRETVTVVDPAAAARMGRLEIRLLERDAQIEDLQTRLDDTRREFVRTLARLQTSTNRAEAASGMAEAEVALQSLKAGGEQAAGVAQVTQLVQEGAAEFNKQNFGGALYLASQAKLLAASYRIRPGDGRGITLRPGETLFTLHLSLKAASRANIRQGPGTNFAIVFAVDEGDALTGHSYVDEWIRVTDSSGREGWVFRSLVAKR